MKNLLLGDILDLELSNEDVANYIKDSNDEFYLTINYSYIGSCQSHVDVMQDHLEVSFIIENILKFAELINFEKNYSKYPYFIILCLRSLDNQKLSETLQKMSLLKAENKDPDEEDLCEIMDEIDDFENNLECFKFKFPEEIDDYYANYVNAGIYEIASEFSDDEDEYLKNSFSKNPEYQYGFWQMHIPEVENDILYGSTYCWIISPNIDIVKVLSKYSGIDNGIEFIEASKFVSSEVNIIINDFAIIDINSLSGFNNSILCIDHLLSNLNSVNDNKLNYYISKNSDIIQIVYKEYSIVYFKYRILRNEEIKALYTNVTQINSHLNCLMGFGRNLHCDWESLDDGKFEELCYEVIYNHIRFDNNTIRKMGKSRSRDGGRDIVVYTNHEIEPRKKFIIQCKLLKNGESLTRKKMQDVANVILEYEADGYIVMTNAVIDSTLYDMLDGFSKNKNMKIDTGTNYSKYELERYLVIHPGIWERYFRK